MKYLMVCLGNICRTPIAVGLLRKKLADPKGAEIIQTVRGVGYKVEA